MELNTLAVAAAASSMILMTTLPTMAQTGGTQITQCGQTLSQSGNYVVSQTLACDSPAAITIAADNIHLTIRGSVQNASGEGINGSGSNLLIDGGGQVSGGLAGIDLSGDSITVKRLTVIGPNLSGAVALGFFGSNETVARCTVSGSPNGIVAGSGSVIKGNKITVTTAPTFGDAILAGDNNVIAGNVLTPPAQYAGSYAGGDISFGSSNRVYGNSGFAEIFVNGSSNRVYRNRGIGFIGVAEGDMNNTIMGNSAGEASDTNGPPCANVWSRNRFQTESGAVSCIQ
jgi:hypothetical protein